MGLLTVCIGIATTGLPRHIWDIGACVMEIIWREMMDLIGVPEWVLLMMETIDRSGHHREPLNHIDCAMTVTAKDPIY